MTNLLRALWSGVRQIFCWNHDYEIVYLKEHSSVKGLLVVGMLCRTCGSKEKACHDLSEEENSVARQLWVEKLLFAGGFLRKEKGKLLFTSDPGLRLNVHKIPACKK